MFCYHRCTGVISSLVSCREPYYPATQPWSLGECLAELLDLAARMLVLGGRLVYWMPDFNERGRLPAPEGGSAPAADSPCEDVDDASPAGVQVQPPNREFLGVIELL